ncbi:MAG TPA: hypothetical protein VGM29_05510 [Polyangiaceae bacterium]
MNTESEAPPDIDERGVDRAQIRRMLALTPIERLRWLEAVMRDVLELRALNDKPSLR